MAAARIHPVTIIGYLTGSLVSFIYFVINIAPDKSIVSHNSLWHGHRNDFNEIIIEAKNQSGRLCIENRLIENKKI